MYQYVPTEYELLKSKTVCLKHQLLLLTGIRHNIIQLSSLYLNAKQFLHTCATVHLYSFLDLHLATRKT